MGAEDRPSQQQRLIWVRGPRPKQFLAYPMGPSLFEVRAALAFNDGSTTGSAPAWEWTVQYWDLARASGRAATRDQAVEDANLAWRRVRMEGEAPDSIVRQHHDRHELERDFAGNEASPARSIWTAHDISWRASSLEKAISRRRKSPEAPFQAPRLDGWQPATRSEHEVAFADMMRGLDEAVAYEAEMARILAASDWNAVKAREAAAGDALAAAVGAVLTEPADTLAGIVVKAEALDAYARLPPYNRAMAALNGQFAGIGS